ncbi:transcriptional regulator [Nonomuraea sp. ATR24]|uniref:transcriptional regulator n=1 Tax=unclassified Nonomuraea TaxID=2593643 RepID=UPI0033E896D7
MTQPAFDETIHAPIRLRICAMLAAVESAEFSVVRDSIGISDSVLSKHAKVLQTAGYLDLAKARRTTWLSLTASGRAALAGHLAELRRIAALAELTGPEG